VSGADSIAASAIFWGAVLIAAIIALGAIIWLARWWTVSAPRTGDETVWSLQHLREMKAEGRITEGEFEALKFKALEAARSAAERRERATSAGDRQHHQQRTNQ
jgi:hypothetical protein